MRAGSRGLIALIITAVSWLIPTHSWAQSTRPYQMTLLGSVDAQQPLELRPPVISYNASVDIPTFYFGRERMPPTGPMIVWLAPTDDMSIYSGIDWSRTLAVYVDEPYISALGWDGPACDSATGAPIVQGVTNKLSYMASVVRAKGPKTRFWVNYNWQEVNWMRNSGCALNHAFIDVVSVDRYGTVFQTSNPRVTSIKPYYDYLGTHRPVPHQQFALIPGTMTSWEQTDSQGAQLLPGFFAYAHDQNQVCDLPLGPVGTTGFYDGCRVWMVAGFIGGVTAFVDGGTLYPIEHPNTQQIRAVWEAQVAIPRDPPPPDMSRFNRLWVLPVLKTLLN